MKQAIVVLVCWLNAVLSLGQTTDVRTAGTGTFTVPCGVTSITVECWGGGGGGGGTGNTTARKGGGGGGAYARSVLPVSPGQTFTFTVGAGGAGGSGNADGENGTASNFGNLVIAAGGMRSVGTAGGEGGTVALSTGTIRFAGGNGAAASILSSGGGGGGAGTTANGGPAVGVTAGNGGTANGGAGGNGVTNANGNPGLLLGGGGSGAARTNGTRTGGSGARGEIRITYTVTPNSGCNMCDAIPITSFPYTVTMSNAGYNNLLVGGCNGNDDAVFGQGRDVYFSVNVPANSYLKVQLTGANPAFWKQVGIGRTNDGLCTGQIGCHTNGAWSGGIVSPTGTTESHCRNIWFPNAGTYYIVYDTDQLSEVGQFTLNVDQYFPEGGDACINAIGMNADQPVSITNTNCIYSSGSDDPSPASLVCAGTLENTNWLVFQSNGNGLPVSVVVDNVACQPGYFNGTSFAAPAGEFGILTSATNACGGSYSLAVPCVDIPSGGTYVTTLPNNLVRNYYFVWDGNGGSECNYRLSVSNVNPLPIELIYFQGSLMGRSVNLSWKTASEVNNQKFLIERSTDGTTWKPLAEVPGAIQSSVELLYTWVDDEPEAGLNYYRLLQVDLNGAITESGITVVEGPTRGAEIELFPNPVQTDQSFLVRLPSPDVEGMISFRITDVQGADVYATSLPWSMGTTNFELTHRLHAGAYLLFASDTTGRQWIARFVVQ